MTLPQNVKDAVTELQRKAFAFDVMVAAGWISKNLEEQSLALSDGLIELQHAATISARLMSQEAEIERLTSRSESAERDCREYRLIQIEDSVRAELAESRLASANALLREIYSKIIGSLAAITNTPTPDRLFDTDALPRDPVMREVMRIRDEMDRLSTHLQGVGDEA